MIQAPVPIKPNGCVSQSIGSDVALVASWLPRSVPPGTAAYDWCASTVEYCLSRRGEVARGVPRGLEPRSTYPNICSYRPCASSAPLVFLRALGFTTGGRTWEPEAAKERVQHQQQQQQREYLYCCTAVVYSSTRTKQSTREMAWIVSLPSPIVVPSSMLDSTNSATSQPS